MVVVLQQALAMQKSDSIFTAYDALTAEWINFGIMLGILMTAYIDLSELQRMLDMIQVISF